MIVAPFDLEDQKWFAKCTGDYNPIHLDFRTAQRSMFGSPIVHGVHSLIRVFDQVADDKKIADFINACYATGHGFEIKVKFSNPVHLGEECRIEIVKFDQDEIKIAVFVDALKVTDVSISKLSHFEASALKKDTTLAKIYPLAEGRVPTEFDEKDVSEIGGELACKNLHLDELLEKYEVAAALFGSDFIAQIAPLSALVGMYVPGRYSIFSTLRLKCLSKQVARPCDNSIQFSLEKYDARFGLLLTQVAASSYFGMIEAFQRPPPVEPPKFKEIVKLFVKNRFENKKAMIIGGSRGLGALLSKALVAEGCDVVSTYASSKAEIERLAGDINSKRFSSLKFDVLKTGEELAEVLNTFEPDYIFYMPTPHIFVRRTRNWDQDLYEKFCRYYLGGLASIAGLAATQHKAVSIYNPSSVVIDQPIDALFEYRIAKIASEEMASTLNKKFKSVEIINHRLPRLLTDQNTQVMAGQGEDMISVVESIFQKLIVG